VAFLFLTIALLGLADAGYLTWHFYSGIPPPCTINGCEIVLTSPYAAIAGIPVALWGVGYYATLVLIVSAALLKKRSSWLIAAFAVTPIGFLMSLYFLAIQAVLLHSYCLYCLASAGISTTLFAIAAFAIHRRKWYTVANNTVPLQ
jgi:uncharacterized membrane protein